MQPSDNGARLHAAVEAEVAALEALCGRIERALMSRAWNALGDAIADSRRVTHALQNALDDAADVRDPEFDLAIFKRIASVHGVRENQMARLQQYHDAVGERLNLIGRWKAALRSISFGKGPQPVTLSALDKLS